MQIIITILISAIYIILAIWSWHNLGNIKKERKIIFLIIGIIITLLITIVVYNISKSGIQYENSQIESSIGNILIVTFTGLNALIIIPYFARLIDKINEKEIEKEQLSKRIIVILVIFLIFLILECSYLKNTQTGILEIYNSLK